MIDLSIIVPIYNDADDLWSMATALAPHIDRIVGAQKWQFVLVNNGSSDNSPQVVQRIIEIWPNSIRIDLPRPDYGEALAQGLSNAEGNFAYIVNVDFWDELFLAWCWRCRDVYDLVLGSKRADPFLNHQHKYRRLLSWALNSILQFAFGFVGTDTHGQKFITLPTVRPIIAQCVMRRGQFDTELTLRTMRQGLWLAEVPVPIHELRPPRNLMVMKIYRNLCDIVRLKRVIRLVPAGHPIRYHRWAREDIEGGSSLQGPAHILLEKAAQRHRLSEAQQGAADAG
ncbi:MAG TPA: glycosyltransferase [Stellaceae bacterium]|nr:glycosyltransferase [Stellaceae bacterium]